jgi:hypothetical protein
MVRTAALGQGSLCLHIVRVNEAQRKQESTTWTPRQRLKRSNLEQYGPVIGRMKEKQ